MLLIIIQLFIGDDSRLLPGIEFTDLFQGKELIDPAGRIVHHIFLRQLMCLHDSSGHNDRTHILQASDTHQHGRHGFITAGYEYAAIEYCGIGLCLHEIRNGIAVCQGVIDPIVTLGDTVTHISSKISGCLAAIFIHSLYRFFHEYIQMGGAGMAVSV